MSIFGNKPPHHNEACAESAEIQKTSSFGVGVKNLSKHFDGVMALDNLSLEFPSFSVVGVIGPNGSGKTTLLNLLSGLFPYDRGVITISEVKLQKIIPQEISFYGLTRTFQEVRLFNQMKVLDNLLVVLTERQVFGALFEKHNQFHLKRAEELLQKVGLAEKRNELAINLSYGQRKLLEIARALAMDAKIYLLDEPFAGLSPAMVKTVTEIIRGLKKEDKTVILVEHDMDLIRSLVDYLFVLDSGTLLAFGAPQEVLEKKEVIDAYLGI